MAFFDNYPRFYETSTVSANRQRLNARHGALIDWNHCCIRDCSILDIASHDGRWSFSALAAGARRVIGIEPRHHLVAAAEETFRVYGMPPDRFTFVIDDVYDELPRIPAGSVDTVFCFGFFYHTMNHVRLLSDIVRLRPKYLLMDTCVSSAAAAIVELRLENGRLDAAGIPGQGMVGHTALVGHPSRKALHLMLDAFGFRVEQYDWSVASASSSDGIDDYRRGTRITLRCHRATDLASPLPAG